MTSPDRISEESSSDEEVDGRTVKMSEQQITQEAQESLQPINDTTLIQMKKARKAKWMRAKQINKDGSPKRVKSRKTHKSPKTEMRRGSVDMEPSMLQSLIAQ